MIIVGWVITIKARAQRAVTVTNECLLIDICLLSLRSEAIQSGPEGQKLCTPVDYVT